MSTEHLSDSVEAAHLRRKLVESEGPSATPGETSEVAQAITQARTTPQATSPHSILRLQRAVGNRAVSQLVQTKLMVGPADDVYEQEADKVADNVLSAPATPAPVSNVQRTDEEDKTQAKRIQRTDEELQEKRIQRTDEELQEKRIQRTDEELQEKRIQRTDEELQEKRIQRTDEELQEKRIQRTDEELQEKRIQRVPDGGAGFEAGADVESRISANKGGGQSLPDDTRQFMEDRIGADFSGVKIHTGGESTQLNRDLQAQAFTHGSDIFFGEGKYNPDSSEGKHLLAHELTHTVQQGAAAQTKREEAV